MTKVHFFTASKRVELFGKIIEIDPLDLNRLKITWRKVPGVEGLKASTIGMIKVADTNKLLPPYLSKGYRTIAFNNKRYKVSILIARAFVSNPEKKKFVNHKNGVKDCDFAWNLEWVTNAENTTHAIYELGHRTQFGMKQVRILKEGKEVVKMASVSEAAKFAGGQSTQVSRVISGKRTHYKGYQFEEIPQML